ncbi:MAG: hypothetical protein ACKV2T_26275 [Kofleriaceae bacterium]
MRAIILAIVAFGATALAPERADAYPQYQLSHDQTCTGCHLSPSGGNLLNENGLAAKEAMSQLGTAPEFFYGKLGTPAWLHLGGDVRGSAGYLQTPEKALAAFPMQIELYATAKFGGVSLHTNFGPRPSQFGNRAATSVWAREHYIMWQQKADEGTGLYVRGGRFMPVFGLRLVEHPLYTRRFGGTPLWGDTYGLHVAYIHPKFEAHATGFLEDPLISPVVHDTGGAAYAEYRITEKLQVGAGAMITRSDDDKKFRYSGTAKFYVPEAKLLLQAEFQFLNQQIDVTPTNPVGGAPNQLVANLVGTLSLNDFIQVDLGIGYYNTNIRISELDRECGDINVRYALTSHVELQLNTRFEMVSFGKGGPSGAYALTQLHYRL